MRKSWVFITVGAAALLLLPQAAMAGGSGTTCSELVTRCKATTEMYSDDRFCAKMVASVVKANSGICIPSNKKSTVEVLETEFVQWANIHPEIAPQDAEDCLLVWLDEKYSCH